MFLALARRARGGAFAASPRAHRGFVLAGEFREPSSASHRSAEPKSQWPVLICCCEVLKTFELENNIQETDVIYKYDNATNQKICLAGWTKDPAGSNTRISALAS